jgi:hypothetical protein
MRTGTALGVAILVAAAGCGPKPPVKATLAGRVVFEVPPEAQAPLMIHLQPLDDANKNNTPSTPLKADGSFEFEPCLIGKYNAYLMVVPTVVGGPGGAGGPGAPPTPPGGATAGLPSKYFSPTLSKWEVNLPEGDKSDVVFTVSKTP